MTFLNRRSRRRPPNVHSVVPWIIVLAAASGAVAVPIELLDSEQPWVLRSLEVRGAAEFDHSAVTPVMTTRPRAWWAPWRAYPALDPLTLREDVERVQTLYRREGFYEATVVADATIAADERTVDVVITITEGPPVMVADVSVVLDGTHVPDFDALVARLPVRRGERFREHDYDAGRRDLRRAYRGAGYARVVVQKRARVDLDRHEADVTYAIVSGVPCVFGEVHVSGTTAVAPSVVLAEVAFRPGDPFRDDALERTRRQLQQTNLFTVITVGEAEGTGDVVDVEIDVREAPPRDIRVGIGYDTEEGPRGTAGWRHFNFFGGGRQLGVTARVSTIFRTGAVDFIQPHWPFPTYTTRTLAAYQQQIEESFDLDRVRLAPRLEWRPRTDLMTYLAYRFDYDTLSDVPDAVKRALPGGAPAHAIVSGLEIGGEVVLADDAIDPKHGVVFAGTIETAGLGGDVHLVRALSVTSLYYPLGIFQLFGAARLRLGVVAPIAGDEEVPLYERLYAGGVNSVRGYERWHVGPLVDGDPLGGRTLVDMSFELRRVIVGDFGGVVFLDAGQVNLRTDEVPFDNLQFGTGVGLRYLSPVGPIRIDLGFPLDRPAGDAAWQVTLGIGRSF